MVERKNENESPRVLNVYLNEIEVGSLSLLADDRTLFVFGESYINNAARPTLSLWFKTPLGELKTQEKIRSQAMLPPFFSNLLPEGRLREYLAKNVNVKPGREFFLLAALGEDLPGAVKVKSVETLQHGQAEVSKSARLQDQTVLRFSLAGVQLKFSAVMESRGGLTIPASGVGGRWIIKLPSQVYKHVPEAEYSMLTLAREAGIVTPEFKLVKTTSIVGLPVDIDEKFGDSLIVKRFDRRDDGSRIHMEDFAQIFGTYPDQKYENASLDRVGYVLLSECGEADFIEFIRRLVFTVVTGNGDMHLKNWSLLYPDTHHPCLSPAYDFVPTILYLSNDKLGLRLGGQRSFKQVTEENFAALASRAAASQRLVLNIVRDTIIQIRDAWKTVRLNVPLTNEMKKNLDLHMGKMKLTR